ncbi:MAG: tRNA pseudouridine(38-40) synthase TruA [Rubrivivax sp.]|nr:tRNA pseudouridine(38-40) synthase TruA [Rubrivivax sp.]
MSEPAAAAPPAAPASAGARVALGVAYRGAAYDGWQSQPSGRTVQDALERALRQFADAPVRTVCAGRTDAGVHALNQVVHFDAPVVREPFSWVRGTNRYLPADIAVQWCRTVSADFHARNSARGRRYRYVLRESPARPAVEAGACGWVFQALDGAAMREAGAHLLGEHDFSAFRAAECQATTPVKTLRALDIAFRGEPLAGYWHFDFDATAFLHHMVRNILGCLVAVGSGRHPPAWMAEVLASRRRELAAPTFPAEGLYFLGPYYDARHDVPVANTTLLWLP